MMNSRKRKNQANKKPPVACVFAHPDDEAFGPGGTIAKLARARDVYIICATKGEVGKDSRIKKRGSLHEHRANELRASARILGVKKVFFLGFKDGTLSNNLYHALARKIEAILKKLKPDTILTYEPQGISGHIDHITVSMVSSFVFNRNPNIKTLLQYCLPAERAKGRRNYFIYFPPGYDKKNISMIVHTADVWETKKQAMLAHQSQIHDIKHVMKFAAHFPKKEHFLKTTKKTQQ